MLADADETTMRGVRRICVGREGVCLLCSRCPWYRRIRDICGSTWSDLDAGAGSMEIYSLAHANVADMGTTIHHHPDPAH
jgi:hypothetical protein